MAARRNPSLAVRATVVLALAASSLLGAFPRAGRAAFPATVVRRVRVDVAALAPEGVRRPLALGRNGVLRTTAAARTRAARVCAPIWFTAVGFTWEQRGEGETAAEVAVSDDGRSFARTRELESEGGADPGSAEPMGPDHGTNLLWTDGGRCVRIALDLPSGAAVAGLRAVFVNSSGTAAGPGTGPPDAGPGAGLEPASAMTRRGRIITREQWGADPRLLNCTPDVAPALKMGFVHHTAGTNSYSRGQVDDILRGIYAFHTNGRGWCDIAYNFLVDKFGRVYEGRSGGITVPVVSAATQGFNTGSFSVSAIGNFSTKRPTTSMMRAIRRVIAWRLDVAHLPPTGHTIMTSGGGDNTRYSEGTDVKLPVISMHRVTGYTACPGNRLAALLDEIREKVDRMGLPKIYRPELSATEIGTGVGDLRVAARASARLTWSVHVEDEKGATFAVLPDQGGDRLGLTWTPSDTAPYPREAGTYYVVVRGTDGDGRLARPARLVFTVKLSRFEPLR